MTGMLQAVDTFRVGAKHPKFGGRMVRAGQIVAADDPIVEGREGYFIPADDAVAANQAAAGPVETATAEPGQKRNTGRQGATRAKAAGKG